MKRIRNQTQINDAIMKKHLCYFFILFLIPIIYGCENSNVLTLQFNTTVPEIHSKLKQMITEENFKIDSEDSAFISTVWRKTVKEENNITDNTIEARLEASLQPVEDGTEVLFKVMKRSSLDSPDPNVPEYSEVELILNDLLYKRWNEKLKALQEEYKKK